MPVPRSRAFIVVDLEDFEGTASDLVGILEDSLSPHDVTVYATIYDMLHDKAAGLDMFERNEPPISTHH